MEPQDPTTEEPAPATPDPRVYHWGVGGIALAAGWIDDQRAIFMKRLSAPLPIGCIPDDHPDRTVARDDFDLVFTFESPDLAEVFYSAMVTPKRPKAWFPSSDIGTEWRMVVEKAPDKNTDPEGGAS